MPKTGLITSAGRVMTSATVSPTIFRYSRTRRSPFSKNRRHQGLGFDRRWRTVRSSSLVGNPVPLMKKKRLEMVPLGRSAEEEMTAAVIEFRERLECGHVYSPLVGLDPRHKRLGTIQRVGVNLCEVGDSRAFFR